MSGLYSDPAVRRRLAEYLGGDSFDKATAVYVTHSDGCLFQRPELHRPTDLGEILDRNLDVARSLADHKSQLFHLDIEYVDFDSPQAAHKDPSHAFAMQEPTVRVIEELLLEWGINPFHFITGQGHHFVWRIGNMSQVARRIASLDPDAELTRSCHARSAGGDVCEVLLEMQGRFAAAALVMEYLAHRIKWQAAPVSAVPVEITAVHVGPCASARREMVSIDISEYGDPLHTRMIRMPYSNYLKPVLSHLIPNTGPPYLMTIPLFEMDVRSALLCREDEAAVRQLAHRAQAAIPLQEEGTLNLLESYLASDLRGFHEEYYSIPLREDGQPALPQSMPPCVSHLLDHPNDRLLKPAGMQLVTRVLLAYGWHPRNIASLIRARFDDPVYAWGVDWQEYDAGMRADFYTRLFAGLWHTGVDRLVDFNCVSTREKGFCPTGHLPGCSLGEWKQTLTCTHPS